VAGYRARVGRIGLSVDNFCTEKIFNDFNSRCAKSLQMLIFIDLRHTFALIERPVIASFKSALQALIRASSTLNL